MLFLGENFELKKVSFGIVSKSMAISFLSGPDLWFLGRCG